MGLANRLAEPGGARSPPRSDRLSCLEQWTLPLRDALANEYRHGMATLETGQAGDGLARYGAGEWRTAGSG